MTDEPPDEETPPEEPGPETAFGVDFVPVTTTVLGGDYASRVSE